MIDPIPNHPLESYNCQELMTIHQNCYSLNTHKVGSTASPFLGPFASLQTVLASFLANSSPRLLTLGEYTTISKGLSQVFQG